MATVSRVASFTFVSVSRREQLGPMSLEELIALLMDVSADRPGQARLEASAIERLSQRQAVARQRLIKRQFENPVPSGELTRNDRALALLDKGDKVHILGPAGTADAYAFHLGLDAEDNRSGIYFSRDRVLSALSARPGLDARSFLLALAYHELFHLFVEQTMGYSGDYKGTPQAEQLEEAAANYAALSTLGKERRNLAGLDRLLFEPYDGTRGLPGYGEFGYLDDRIYDALPYFLSSFSPSCPKPSEYNDAMLSFAATPDAIGSGGQARFEAMLRDEGSVGWYYDMIS